MSSCYGGCAQRCRRPRRTGSYTVPWGASTMASRKPISGCISLRLRLLIPKFRAARGVLLRGEGGALVGHEMWPVALFALAAAARALALYRRRLD